MKMCKDTIAVTVIVLLLILLIFGIGMCAGSIIGALSERVKFEKLLINKGFGTYTEEGIFEGTGPFERNYGPQTMPNQTNRPLNEREV